MQKFNILRVVFFQIVWIIFAGWKFPFEYFAPILALIFIFVDYLIFYGEKSLSKLSIFFVFILVSGVLVDSLLLNFGFISFHQHSSIISPYYLWSIWIIFIPYYQFAFYKFKGKLYLSLPLAIIGAPFAYYGGAKFGNLIIHEYAFLAIAICWSFFFPISIEVYHKLIGE